jgi:hypothetical protein
MPDPDKILRAMANDFGVAVIIAAAFTALLLLRVGWRGRAQESVLPNLGWIIAVVGGFVVGTVALGLEPDWVMKEFHDGFLEKKHLTNGEPVEPDQPKKEFYERFVNEFRDRFLFVLLPAVVLVELIATIRRIPRWAAWLLRAIVAAGAAPIVLHRSVYLEELAGPGSREWTPQETAWWLGGLAIALLAGWALLSFRMHKTPTRAAPAALAIACGAAAVTIMYSGLATDGQLGLPLAAALAGATLASFILPAPPRGSAAIGIGIVALFGLLVGGRFFADLTTTHAALLFAGPLLCGATPLPIVRTWHPWLRFQPAVLATALLAAVVVFQAQREFNEKSKPPSGSDDPSIEEYYKSL